MKKRLLREQTRRRFKQPFEELFDAGIMEKEKEAITEIEAIRQVNKTIFCDRI